MSKIKAEKKFYKFPIREKHKNKKSTARNS